MFSFSGDATLTAPGWASKRRSLAGAPTKKIMSEGVDKSDAAHARAERLW
jgi:hypothetical protein